MENTQNTTSPQARPLFKVHDLTALSMSSAYDETQTAEHIKPGDLLVVQDGIAILDAAWPVMIVGESKHFHHLNVESTTWEERAANGIDYLAQVKLAKSKSKVELVLLAAMMKDDVQTKKVSVEVHACDSLCINVPQFFADPEFATWLNSPVAKFTWHSRGAPVAEYSDVVVLVDPSLNGEGADTDMPRHIWDQIVDICKQHFKPTTKHHIMVRLTNLQV